MIPFERIITSTYTTDEIIALDEKALQMKTHLNYSGLRFSRASLMPLAMLNPTKGLRTVSAKQYAITASEANDENLRHFCRIYNEVAENEHEIITIHLKRGITFIYNYLQQQNYIFLDRISLYLQQGPHHKIRAYKKDRRVIIITNEPEDKIETQIFSAIPLFFKDEFTWDDETIAYFKASTDSNLTTMTTLYKTFVAKYKILTDLKKTLLRKNLDFAVTLQKRESEKNLKRIENDIQSYEQSLCNLYKQQREEQARITFFKATQDIDEITEYILANPYIVDYYAHNEKYFVVAIEAPLEYIDAPALKKMLSNTTSYLYPHFNGNNIPRTILNHETEFVMMLKDLFLKNRYKVYTRSEIVFDFEKKQAYPLRRAGDYSNARLTSTRPLRWQLSQRYQTSKERCITPHMHIEFYDCWSGNKTNIAKALNKTDIIGALDIAISTTKDINVNDGAVFGRFISQGLFNPYEVNRGITNEREEFRFAMPGDQFKTIYDTERKCFRTFQDIFQNDYLQGKLQQTDLDEDFSDFII